MATQRITIAKIAGEAGMAVVEQFRKWAAAPTTQDLSLWDPEQWPASVRQEVDRFAVRLRLHAADLPVLYFCEWIDRWSMFDLFLDLRPNEAAWPLSVYANQFEAFCYALPNDEALIRRRAQQEHQFQETSWFVTRLCEAIEAWGSVAAALVVLREVSGGSALDREIEASLEGLPPWVFGED